MQMDWGEKKGVGRDVKIREERRIKIAREIRNLRFHMSEITWCFLSLTG